MTSLKELIVDAREQLVTQTAKVADHQLLLRAASYDYHHPAPRSYAQIVQPKRPRTLAELNNYTRIVQTMENAKQDMEDTLKFYVLCNKIVTRQYPSACYSTATLFPEYETIDQARTRKYKHFVSWDTMPDTIAETLRWDEGTVMSLFNLEQQPVTFKTIDITVSPEPIDTGDATRTSYIPDTIDHQITTKFQISTKLHKSYQYLKSDETWTLEKTYFDYIATVGTHAHLIKVL
jgi:hypothetical protein